MPVERDAEYYNMNHKKRGLAFIFNHKVNQKIVKKIESFNHFFCLFI